MKIFRGFLLVIASSFLLFSCHNTKNTIANSNEKSISTEWNIEELKKKATEHLDSANWDFELFKQDIESYTKYSEIFKSFPLNKSPFPVATYDYAVFSTPFTIKNGEKIIKGVRIGEFENLESEKEITKLTLLILTNDEKSEENTLVDSRNYPYLTAQGSFKVKDHEYNWVFSASPDSYATLLLNMKLFDLRFGETVIIYPQKDKSFYYEQIDDSPNNYNDFEDYKKAILNIPKVKTQLNSDSNI